MISAANISNVAKKRLQSDFRDSPSSVFELISRDELSLIRTETTSRFSTSYAPLTSFAINRCLQLSFVTARWYPICALHDLIALSTVIRFLHVQPTYFTMGFLSVHSFLAILTLLSSASAQQVTLISNTLPACAQSCPVLIQAQSACVPPPLGAAAVSNQQSVSTDISTPSVLGSQCS